MMHLITGLPGDGKTLYTLDMVEALRQRENREVYYFGIQNLALPWHSMHEELRFVKRWNSYDSGEVKYEELEHGEVEVVKGPKDWYKLPPNSIIVIDEELLSNLVYAS